MNINGYFHCVKAIFIHFIIKFEIKLKMKMEMKTVSRLLKPCLVLSGPQNPGSSSGCGHGSAEMGWSVGVLEGPMGRETQRVRTSISGPSVSKRHISSPVMMQETAVIGNC